MLGNMLGHRIALSILLAEHRHCSEFVLMIDDTEEDSLDCHLTASVPVLRLEYVFGLELDERMVRRPARSAAAGSARSLILPCWHCLLLNHAVE